MAWLPDQLAPEANVIWDVPLGRASLGGVAADETHLFFGDRDLDSVSHLLLANVEYRRRALALVACYDLLGLF